MLSSVARTFTLTAFALLSVSCVTWTTKDVKTMTERLPDNTEILSVLKASGECVEFSKSNPGRLRGYTIVGTAKDPVSEPMDLTGPFSLIKNAKGTVLEVTDGGGQVHAVLKVLSTSGNQMKVLASTWTQVSIPLAEAQRIEVKKSNVLKIAAITSAIILGLTLGWPLLAHVL